MDYHQLASDPTSDNIMLTILDDSGDVETLEWYGSDWESSFTTHETSSNDTYWNAWFTYDYRPDAVTDRSTYENNGRMEISMTEDDWVPGRFGGGMEIDGSDDFVNVSPNSKIDNIFDGGGTITAWIKPNSFGESSYGRITDKGGDVTDNGAGFFICNDGGTNCTNSLSLFFDFDGANAFWWNAPDKKDTLICAHCGKYNRHC